MKYLPEIIDWTLLLLLSLLIYFEPNVWTVGALFISYMCDKFVKWRLVNGNN